MRLCDIHVPSLAITIMAAIVACAEQPGSEMAPTGTTAEANQPAIILAAGDIAG